MSENEQKTIFSKNLNRLVSRSGKSQKEIADAIGISPQSFNTWIQGTAIPRMGKIQLLADYFHVNKSDLLEEKSGYYINPETAEIAQKIYEDNGTIYNEEKHPETADYTHFLDVLLRKS